MEAVENVDDQAAALAAQLAAAVRLATPLKVRIAGEPHEREAQAAADIELRLGGVARGEAEDEIADVVLGGAPAPRLVARAVPWSEVPQRLVRLVKTYQVERCGRDTFSTWVNSLSEAALRERLGLATPQHDPANYSLANQG